MVEAGRAKRSALRLSPQPSEAEERGAPRAARHEGAIAATQLHLALWNLHYLDFVPRVQNAAGLARPQRLPAMLAQTNEDAADLAKTRTGRAQ